MKSSIKILTAVAIVLVASLSVYAQPGKGKKVDPEKRAEKRTERMVEHLKLNPAQAAEVKEINLEYAIKMKEAHSKIEKGDREAMKALRTEMGQKIEAEYKNVLTADQFATFLAHKEKRKDHRKKGGKKEESFRS